jgi:hypothetical protein
MTTKRFVRASRSQAIKKWICRDRSPSSGPEHTLCSSTRSDAFISEEKLGATGVGCWWAAALTVTDGRWHGPVVSMDAMDPSTLCPPRVLRGGKRSVLPARRICRPFVLSDSRVTFDRRIGGWWRPRPVKTTSRSSHGVRAGRRIIGRSDSHDGPALHGGKNGSYLIDLIRPAGRLRCVPSRFHGPFIWGLLRWVLETLQQG